MANANIAPGPVYAQKLQRRIAIAVVCLPFLGFLVGLVLLYQGRTGWMDHALLASLYILTLLGVEGGFHRLTAHNAFQARTWVRSLLIILGSMAAQGPVLFWAATHRRHHQYTDLPGDPHSPHHPCSGVSGTLRGIVHAHVGWLFVNDNTDSGRYVPDLLKDKFLFRLNSLYPLWVFLGLLIPAIVGGLYARTWVGALSGFLWGGLIRIFLVHHSVWSVNSLCHVFGHRPFKTKGMSTNNIWLCLTSLGGSWHNNHHAFPKSANNSFHWWQFDPCGWVIRLLALFNWAWDVNFPTKAMLETRMSQSGEQ